MDESIGKLLPLDFPTSGLNLQMVPSKCSNASTDFISPLANSKQPPVIVGMAVKRSLRRQEDSPAEKQVDSSVVTASLGHGIDFLEKWHRDMFECPRLRNDCNNNDSTNGNDDSQRQADDKQTKVEVDNEIDLIDFSTDVVEVVPVVQGIKAPKVKKVTFLLEDLTGSDGEESHDGTIDGVDFEGIVMGVDCKNETKEGEWDVSETVERCGWKSTERTAGGNEISTETMQTDDIVSIADDGHGREATKGMDTVQCACPPLHYDSHERQRCHYCYHHRQQQQQQQYNHHSYHCQHPPRNASNGRESPSTAQFSAMGRQRQQRTALLPNNTNTLIELNSDTLPWERKIDQIPEDISGVENARKQNACAVAGNIGVSGRMCPIGTYTSSPGCIRESIDVSRDDEDEGNIVDVQDVVHVQDDEGGSTRVARTVPEWLIEPPRIDETVPNLSSLQPIVKEAENVVISVPTGIEQLEFGPKNHPNPSQLCEKSIQVPSPSRQPSNSAENSGPRVEKEVHFRLEENYYSKSSDSESENYYGTGSPPPPPLVPPDSVPPPYGLNVEVTLNAHISVHGLSDFNFFSAGERSSPGGPFSTEEKILKDCATNTSRNNNANVTPSSADSGIIIIDDDVDDCGGEIGSATVEDEISEPLLLVEDSIEKKPVGQCRDQDTQTFVGNFLQPRNTNEISVQVCENGDSDLRNPDSSDSCVSESEIDERKDLCSPQAEHTDQYLRPPNSFLSEKQECFEASNRLKRLEERFRGFTFTKKLLRESLGSSAVPSQNLSSSLSSLSTLLANCTNTNEASVSSSSVPASSTPSLPAAARAEQEQEDQSLASNCFVPSRKTSSLSCLEKDGHQSEHQLSHFPKRAAPILPPLSSSLLSLSASSLLSLSCIDLERQQRQQLQTQQNTASNKSKINDNNTDYFLLNYPLESNNTIVDSEKSLSKSSSLPSLLPQYLFPAPQVTSQSSLRSPSEQASETSKSSVPLFSPAGTKESLLPGDELVPCQPRIPLFLKTPLDEPYRSSVGTPESSIESEEICEIFPGGKALVGDPLEVVETVFKESEEDDDVDEEVDDRDVTRRSESEENREFFNLEKLLTADPYTNCEFDTRHLNQYEPTVYQIKYCYDELEEELESEVGSVGGILIGSESERVGSVGVSDEDGCECVIEAVPIYRTLPLNMRETTGTLRGLLKKPNRPPPVRKNRVVFDETRNEFFEADYIILIREDCPYDEEDEEPCTCGEHELVRICCDEGCNCGYTDDGRTPPSPKFAPPIEFVDQATLSPPEGYKDGSGLLDNALGGALSGHVFGAQHIQQLQVIQRLQQQRAAMLAARAAAGQQGQQTGSTQNPQTGSSGGPPGQTQPQQQQQQQPQQQSQQPQQAQQQQQQTVCTECAECAECAAKQLHDEECDSQCSDDISPMMEAPLPPHATLPIALVPLQKFSPERRITQKEIVAGEERPKFLTIKQVQDVSQADDDKSQSAGLTVSKTQNQQRYIVETITMTTVTERRIIQKTQTNTDSPPLPPSSTTPPLVTIVAVTSNNEAAASTAVPSVGPGVSSNDLRTLQQKQLVQQLQQKQQQDQSTAVAATGCPGQESCQQQPPTQPASGACINSHYEIGKHKQLSTAQAISGILKGGKLWKNEHQPQQQQQQQQQGQQQSHPQAQQQQHQQQSQQSAQHDDSTNVTSDEETSSKRSVRFTEESTIREACCDGEVQSGLGEGEMCTGKPINYMSDTLKRHSSSLFHNALRPNSAVRQLFPSTAIHPLVCTAGSALATSTTTTVSTATVLTAVSTTNTTNAGNPTALTQEALKAFDDSKKATLVHQHSITSNSSSNNINAGSSMVASGSPGGSNASETDTIRRTIERNALRRSLIKYEPKKKVPIKDVTSLEERIRQLTCDIDEPIDEGGDGDHGNDTDLSEMERRDSPAGEENPQQPKYIPDKSFSPSSSASSSSSGSNGSTYKKITDLFHRDRRHEKIPEADENPIVIIPQDCRCPAGPDIGMGVQIQGAHTQIHQPPQQRQTDSRRQFLSTLAPLTACVAGQRDDLSYYTLAQPGDRNSLGSSACTEYSLGDIDAVLRDDESKKVAPDVIAGTPGQESDELAAFVQQEGARTERLKKRYSTETSTSAPASGAGSDDDEHNDYGFNSRPSVKGIKPRFGSTNEILQQMQAQLAAPSPPQPKSQTSTDPPQPMQSNTLPRPHTASSMQLAAAKQQITTHQHTASWSYYPVNSTQSKTVAAVAAAGTNMVAAVDPHGNYYHIPAQARHSYHGQEAIYQNCAQLPAGNIQANTVHVQSQQIHTQHHAVHTAHHIHQPDPAAYGKFARSPTRRPESPPPLRNYHQTMVLIPYNAETYHQYTAQEQENYRQQHNIVTQQTIRVPVGYPLPGMQLHVVAGRGALPPHYSTLPRLGSGSNAATAVSTPNVTQGKPPAYSQYPMEKNGVKFTERGAPEGAASVQPNDSNSLLSPTSQGHGPPTAASVGPPVSMTMSTGGAGATPNVGGSTAQGQGAVFYAMNV
ncbi:uncharacterized protein LOC129774670 isoform X2 [Toxorhynchites rutilus septentrionalis]|uniref:uncharacterized protein LOC129774670 isoform X2 n=1 Tax=Toxorhynchites rutilus septentrionalis TaxID=329112 RepID=UPI00247A83B7|nr:uncharacterized protein LOC129774670 isoform X2 [Toxorhynchites rutilus septentrionalis]